MVTPDDPEQTGGTCSVLIAELEPGEGPPPHLHRDHDVPRGTTHSFKNIGPSTARLLEWTVPGHNEPYFRAIYEMEVDDGFDPKRLAEINEHFATEFIGR